MRKNELPRRHQFLLPVLLLALATKWLQHTEYYHVTLNGGKEIVNWINDGFWTLVDDYELYPPHTPAFQTKADYLRVYPQLKLLEDNYSLIRQEAESFLLPNRDSFTVLETHFTKKDGSTKGGSGWSTFFLKVGSIIEENAYHTPQTANLLRQIPNLYTAFFSVLEPDVHLKAHWGYYKGFLRYHLGVIIPPNETCWIRTNPNVKPSPRNKEILQQQFEQQGDDLLWMKDQPKFYWRNGEGMLFDDNYLHEAKNESNETRIVLYLNLARRMPWYLDWINRLLLWIAMNNKTANEARRNYVIRELARGCV